MCNCSHKKDGTDRTKSVMSKDGVKDFVLYGFNEELI